MMSRSSSIAVFGAALALTLALPVTGVAHDHDKDKHQRIAKDAVVHFGQPQPQDPIAAATHLLFPDDVTIRRGGTVNFVVDGGGHGIAIHLVSRRTTREDVAADLCQGGANEADRVGRSAVCNGAVVVGGITGTQNLAYQITDGREHLVIEVPENTAAAPNPRVDDTEHSERLLSTSGGVRVCGPGESEPACDSSAPGTDPAGAFLAGSAPPATPGVRIQVQFLKSGRYLVVCQNRAHLINDHMFGFVNVVDDDDDRDHDRER
jgi:hypothetical protein